MAFIDQQLITFRHLFEDAIHTDGQRGKESIIRSSILINLIHDAVKQELIQNGVNPMNIFPHLRQSKPEIKLAGFLKQKNQDVCVIPSNCAQVPTPINWGPLAYENKTDFYGYEFSRQTLVINIRSQMSSLVKNSDTLFERTFAEALNLHMRYPDIVLGEVYLIPVYEYDDYMIKQNRTVFSSKRTNIEKYISFFNSINNRKDKQADYLYERCALLIVDFSKKEPYLFNDSRELKEAGYISRDFPIEYATLNFQDFARDILNVYAQRFDIRNLM